MRTLVVAFAALLFTACATSKPAEELVEVKSTGTPGEALATRSSKVSVTVLAVDTTHRILTVKTADGQTDTFTVGPQVKRLAQIAPGDVITVQLEEGLLLQYQPVGDAAVAPHAVAAAGVAGADAAPAGAVVASVQATVTVVDVSERIRIVTLQGPDGNQYKVKAGPKIQLDQLKIGDRLLATYAASLVVSAEKGGSKL